VSAGAPAPDAPSAGGGLLRSLFAVLAAGGLVAAGLGALIGWALAPADPDASPERFDVPAGASLRRVAQSLEEAGLVRSNLALIGLARWQGVEGKLHAGEYRLSAAWGAARILDEMVAGRVVTYEVVLPEGLSAEEIAGRLEQATLIGSAAEFVALVRDPAVARELGVEGPNLEGYLFPETYQLPHGLTTKQVARVLVDQFRRVWNELEPAARAQGLSMREVVTLASIVEKETGVGEERPLVASVFRNRLARGMRLESDPTTIYGITDFDGNLTRAHLEDEANPWNTYRIAGLPPTPIASPGAASLRAVVHPAESEYLFFVARGDGSHVFSRSFAEHVDNVNRYQRNRRSQ
jgi:UPF0755 protein